MRLLRLTRRICLAAGLATGFTCQVSISLISNKASRARRRTFPARHGDGLGMLNQDLKSVDMRDPDDDADGLEQ